MKEKFLEKLKNKEELSIKLDQDTKVQLTFDEEINAYRGYIKELDMKIGIWEIKTLYEMIKKM